MRVLFRGRISTEHRNRRKSSNFFSDNKELEVFYLDSRISSRDEVLRSSSSESDYLISAGKKHNESTVSRHSTTRKDHWSYYFASFDFLLDLLIGKSYKDIVMEIELSNLGEPQILQFYTAFNIGLDEPMMNILNSALRASTTSDLALSEDRDSFDSNHPGTHFSGAESTELLRVESTSSLATSVSAISNANVLAESSQDQAYLPIWRIVASERSWHPLLSAIFKRFTRYIRPYFPQSRSDDQFYESIRLQPISSGHYICTMLVSGLCNTCFYLFHCLAWSHLTQGIQCTTTLQQVYLSWLYMTTIAQFMLHVFQLPSRVQLHFRCWESSSAADTDGSILILRTMVQGDDWLYNRALNCVIFSIAIFNLILSELYMWSSVGSTSDPIRDLVVSLAATDMLSFWVKAFVAVIFSISMSSSHVLRDAKRRGLSKWDLAELPTCVFTSASEVKTCDCSICLSSFTCGEELISLPCDLKHSFHAGCIRQWLQRQNSCPLCQKIV